MLRTNRGRVFFALWALMLLVGGAMGCGSSNNNNGGGGSVTDPVAQYFVTQFLATNINNANNVIDAESEGLSLYMTLNADKTLSATAQTPDQTPKTTGLTGTWSSSGGNQLSIMLIDEDNASRTIEGSLSEDSFGMVVFTGKQVSGPPINFGDQGEQYTITTLAMAQYPAGYPTLADLAGSYVATTAFVIANTGGRTANLLANGSSQSVVIESNGTLKVTMTEGNTTPVEQSGTIEVVDAFHFRAQLSGEDPKTFTFRYVDDMLTVYQYDTVYTFDSQTVNVPATQVLEFTKQ